MKEIFEDAITFWATALGLTIVSVFIVVIFADRPIRGYYLGESGGKSSPKIMIDINWSPDKAIHLDRNITLNEAADLINKLNEGLN